MNIGEKIRSLRVAKLMTQSELAGHKITRNMLSCIENGNAQPSLSTILYIADRLKVPAGFLLAEASDEIIYQKMNNLGNIKRAYRGGDLVGCRDLCLSSCPEPDDEISLLLADCDLGIAMDALQNGQLRVCCRYFDEAISYAEKTIYPTDHIMAQAEVVFRFLRRISPTLYSESFDEAKTVPLICRTPFSAYVDALDDLDAGNDRLANDFFKHYPEDSSFYSKHLCICLEMQKKQYGVAKEALFSILHDDEILSEVQLYSVLSDLEICCRETDDFKGAYQYTNEKVQLLEKLLKGE